MKKLALLIFVFLSFTAFSQLSDGSYAPDFDLPDTDGTYHSLYDYLDDGYSVVLDFGATWCGPCWSYHQSGILEDVWETWGPNGTDQVMVFMVEADGDTNQQCIYGQTGCNDTSYGDWTAGVGYPILNPEDALADATASDFGITFWPTLYGVAPTGEIYEIGQESADVWGEWLVGSFALPQSFVEVEDNGCFNNLILTIVGGAGDVDVEWSNGSQQQSLISPAPGDYYVTLIDENDFEVELGPFTVEPAVELELEVLQEVNVSCPNGVDGLIEVEMLGGSGDYDYEWSIIQSGPYIYDLPAGEYYLTVTDLVEECEEEYFFEVLEPEEIDADYQVTDAACGANGNVTIIAEGGTGDLEYFVDGLEATSNDIDLGPGTYTVEIIDENNCVVETEIVIAEIPAPTASATNNGQITCLLPSVTLDGSGSTSGGNITYNWYDASNTLIATSLSTSVSIGGTYTLEVVDNSTGCVSIATTTVAQDSNVPAAVSVASNNIDCTVSTATISGAGSATGANISYLWTTSDGSIISDPTMMSISVGSGGTYLLTVTNNSNSCSSTSTSTVIQNSVLPSSNISGNASFCDGDLANLCVELGPSETVQWVVDGVPMAAIEPCIVVSTDAEVTATVSNAASGCSSTSSVTTQSLPSPEVSLGGEVSFCAGESTMICVDSPSAVIFSWSANGQSLGTSQCVTVTNGMTLEVSITNASGCSTTEEVVINELPTPDANFEGETAICDGEEATICVPANADHVYVWLVDGNVVSGESSNCLTVNEEAMVSVVISNNTTSCEASQSTMVELADTPLINTNLAALIDCDNPTSLIDIDVDDPTATFNWYDEQGNLIGMTEDIEVASGGIYTVEVTNMEGCSTTETVTVDQSSDVLPDPTYGTEATGISVNFTNTTNTDFTTILWDFGDGNTSESENPSHTYAEPGVYNVCLTIGNDCGIGSTCVQWAVFYDIEITPEIKHVSCHGGSDGRIDLSVQGGGGTYSYIWAEAGLEGPNPEGLPAGEYTLVVNDQYGGSLTEVFTILEPDPISSVETIEDATAGQSNGSISVELAGGTAPYLYSWSNGAEGNSISDLMAGIYTVEITDANNCLASFTYEVKEVSAVDNLLQLNSFEISPNPASNEFNFAIEFDSYRDSKIEMISSLGQLYYSQLNSGVEISGSIEVSDTPAGVYFLQVSSAGKYVSKKVIVIH